MKLVRFGPIGKEKPGVLLDDQRLIDVSERIKDYDRDFFSADGLESLDHYLQSSSFQTVDVEHRLGPPVFEPSKIVCVGLNYAGHVAESGMDIPEEPVLFFKASTAIVGPYDHIIIPKGSEKTDWEVELAVVIGRKASYVDLDGALDHVAGYVLHNDISERAFQLERAGQWVKGKSADSFAPLGPWLVTKDEIEDPHNLDLWLKVNGEIRQSSNTSDMIFKVPFLVSYISQFMTLLPGDIISTGTPFGVGMGLNPPQYLKPGDVVELGITGLGEARQEVIAYKKFDK
ncbi:MAG: fumarylacetoacetate hydrolase family protein [Bacteroidetes bacterium]|nr:fumarylacetoacetate hydrolase family protein [Bacteroidota bacterium]